MQSAPVLKVRSVGVLDRGDVTTDGVESGPYPYTPYVWGISEKEMRRRKAAMLYELEAALGKMGEPSGTRPVCASAADASS
jgi:hypothetical protein